MGRRVLGLLTELINRLTCNGLTPENAAPLRGPFIIGTTDRRIDWEIK